MRACTFTLSLDRALMMAASVASSSPSSEIPSIRSRSRGRRIIEDSDSDDEPSSSRTKRDISRSLSRTRSGRSRASSNKGKSVRWRTLEHNGPWFPPKYVPLPSSVNFYYNGRRVKLSPESEEVATFYAKMLNHDYTKNSVFNCNFFNDWRQSMSNRERNLITDLKRCDFKRINDHFKEQLEMRKSCSSVQKRQLREEQEKINQKYGYCTVDGTKEKVGNFRIEPPGLFRGRGSHPRMGRVKERIEPNDVTINIGAGTRAPRPPCKYQKNVLEQF